MSGNSYEREMSDLVLPRARSVLLVAIVITAFTSYLVVQVMNENSKVAQGLIIRLHCIVLHAINFYPGVVTVLKKMRPLGTYI